MQNCLEYLQRRLFVPEARTFDTPSMALQALQAPEVAVFGAQTTARCMQGESGFSR